MANESVFRFMLLRPAVVATDPEPVTPLLRPFADVASDSRLLAELIQARDGGGGRPKVKVIAARFREGASYVKDLGALPLDVTPLLGMVAQAGSQPVSGLDFDALAHAAYGRGLSELIASAEWGGSVRALADTLLADSVAGAAGRARDPIAIALKLLLLLRLAAEGRPLLATPRSLRRLLSDLSILLPHVVPDHPAHVPSPPAPPAPDPLPGRAERVAALSVAHRELSRLAMDERAFERPGVDLPVVERVTIRPAATAPPAAPSAEVSDRADSNDQGLERPTLVLAARAVDRLRPETRALLPSLGLDAAALNPIDAVSVIETEMAAEGEAMASARGPRRLVTLGGMHLDRDGLLAAFAGRGAGGTSHDLGPHPACQMVAGIGDLLMVKQRLKAYEVTEFAHTENVLQGESREREHRRLNVREEITEIETERETQQERDLESTERSEMQSEAERTVRSETQVEAGLQISGSYGPSISFSASASASFSSSTEESQRRAQSYSREVTERTAERVRERVREARRRRILEEIEETNRHRVDNSGGDGHVRGIYRWLDKIYDAQVFCYGQRMLYEFVIPEPAAFFLYGMVENPPPDLELVKPDPPRFLGAPLKPENLTRTNYQSYVAEYEVTNVPAPPSQLLCVAFFERHESAEGSHLGRASKIEIPEGYEAYAAMVSTDWVFTHKDEKHRYRVMIGGRSLDRTDTWGADFYAFTRRFRKEVAIAVKLMRAKAFALGVDVFCELTADGLAKWQQAVYDAILSAYQRQKAEYDEKVAVREIQQGPAILGRNPLENRRLEREELKKLALMMLTGSPDLARNSYGPSPEPVIDVAAACDNGAFIRFFENAFEWNHLLYVFYPYFWARKPRWILALHLIDPDPDFAAFLKAGASRVQVPVRPGFERAVAHFCQFGEIWEGNDPPLADDELYVPIVDEITETLGGLDEGVPYPEGSQPWEVRVPTSLVLLQDLKEIATIRDVMTGEPIDIGAND